MTQQTKDKKIIKMYLEGKPYESIAKAVDKSKVSVVQRVSVLRKLGVNLPARKPVFTQQVNVDTLNQYVLKLTGGK